MAQRVMSVAKTLSTALSELRALSRPRVRRSRMPEIATHIADLAAACRTTAVEPRAGGLAIRLSGETERGVTFVMTCTLHGPEMSGLTAAETAVTELLCEGRTRAQIARVRGVSTNTIKSQIRQIFRKLNVDTRVALVRRWCP
jgi:DNA-binding CsgD family transcriptional regulator